MEELNYIILIVGLLLCSSIFASRISSVMGLPVLLLFLGLGMLCGSNGIILHIDFNNYNLAYLVANFALAIILFDGGCQTSFYAFRQVAKPAIILSTIGVLLTTFIVGTAAYYILYPLGLGFPEAILVGAIVGSTDAGAVFSLLGGNGISLKNKVSYPLQMESATNDPMAIFLTITVINFITGVYSEGHISQTILQMVQFLMEQFLYGVGFGIIFGFIGRYIINHINIPTGLYSLLVLGIAFTGFAITASINGSGFLAIFIIGMFIGNQNTRQLNYIRPVQDGLNWLSQICLFLMLGLLVTPVKLLDYLVYGLLIALVMTFLARPIAVFLCLKPFLKYSNSELTFISWVGLRGSVPIVLAIYPMMMIPDGQYGDLYFNITFVIVLFSLLVQGATILPMAKFFGAYAPSMVAPLSKGKVGITIDDDYEIFNYEVQNKKFENMCLKDIKFPSKTLIASVFRNGQMFKPTAGRKLKRGDIISIIGHEDDELFLNAIFNGEAPIKTPHYYNGDIVLAGSLMMPEVSERYGLIITSLEKELSLAEFMNYQLGGFPQVGDRIIIVDVILTVHELQGDNITKVGFEKITSF